MKLLSLLFFICLFISSYGQVVLNADGPGNTYELITSVLAPGYNPIETPDCNHAAFGEHIDEVFDNELNANVFRFHIHTTPDNDRCINFDRQRNEIKSYDKSPDNLLGIDGERVRYKWKFKLTDGFQSSPNFTHLHQLKSVGGSLASMPMYTLTTRKGSPDKLELRYAETDSQVTLKKTDLAPFIGRWLEVTEKIKYGIEGTYEILINDLATGDNLFSYSSNAIINWRNGADFVRPKWGIYRSLLNSQDLRDETVLFANFSVEELASSSSDDLEIIKNNLIFFHDADKRVLTLRNCPSEVELVRILTIDGNLISEKKILRGEKDSRKELLVSLPALTVGTYVINLEGSDTNLSKLILITN